MSIYGKIRSFHGYRRRTQVRIIWNNFKSFLSTMSESEKQAINNTEEAAGTQKTGEHSTENVASEEQQSTEVQQRSDIS